MSTRATRPTSFFVCILYVFDAVTITVVNIVVSFVTTYTEVNIILYRFVYFVAV